MLLNVLPGLEPPVEVGSTAPCQGSAAFPLLFTCVPAASTLVSISLPARHKP